MPNDFYEDEVLNTKFSGKVFSRILKLTLPHWRWVAGFLVCILFTSVFDAYFTYLSKRIIDEGIVARNAHRTGQHPDPIWRS